MEIFFVGIFALLFALAGNKLIGDHKNRRAAAKRLREWRKATEQ